MKTHTRLWFLYCNQVLLLLGFQLLQAVNSHIPTVLKFHKTFMDPTFLRTRAVSILTRYSLPLGCLATFGEYVTTFQEHCIQRILHDLHSFWDIAHFVESK